MLSLLDIAERIQKGPKMDENTWNMGMFHKMNDLTQKYQLFYPKDSPVFNTDDKVVDRAWRAALDFMVEKGVYCLTTGRVIQFTEPEILSTIKGMPEEVTIGEGKDARVLKQRRIEEREGLNHCPGLHAPFSEDIGPMVVKNYAEIPTADFLQGFNFPTVDGREVFGLPMEVYATKRQVTYLRQGVARAGRPGLAVAYYPINTRAPALIAPMDRETGLRPTDGILLSVLPDLKVESDVLTAAIAWEEYGGFKFNHNGLGYVGGFAGGLGGAMIESLVATLAGWIVYHDIATSGRITSTTAYASAKDIAPKIPEVWASSVVSQALHCYTNDILFRAGGVFSGPGTEDHLLEVACRAITIPIDGANVITTRQGRTSMNAGQTPLSGEWSYEVAAAVMRTGLNRESAGDLLLKIAEKLKGRTPPEGPGRDIREFYDLVHHRPLPELEKAYLKVKEELSTLGLSF